MASVEDVLLKAYSLSHHGDLITEDEELTLSLENFVHPEFPKLVKQRYGTELRSRTLASIKPVISQALDVLLKSVPQMTRKSYVLQPKASAGQSPPSLHLGEE